MTNPTLMTSRVCNDLGEKVILINIGAIVIALSQLYE